jgi:hypothetical protein
MRAVCVPTGSLGEPYWQHKAVETERQLVSVQNEISARSMLS